MEIVKITKDNFEKEVLNSSIPVLADFNAEWCGPCRMLGPILEEVAKKSDSYKIVSINIDDEDELAEKFNVSSIPCLVLFKDGQEVSRSVGLRPQDEIEAMLGDK